MPAASLRLSPVRLAESLCIWVPTVHSVGPTHLPFKWLTELTNSPPLMTKTAEATYKVSLVLVSCLLYGATFLEPRVLSYQEVREENIKTKQNKKGGQPCGDTDRSGDQ